MSQTKVGAALGVSRYPVMEWEKGKKFPDVAQLGEIASLLGVSAAYLIGESDDPSPGILSERNRNVNSREVPNYGNMVKIPVLDGSITIYCGSDFPLPKDNYEDTDKFFVLPASIIGRISSNKHRRPFSLRIDGDSMEHAGIYDGDYVMVNPEEPVYDGDAAVVVYGTMCNCAVKRIYWLSDKDGKFGVRLRSADGTGWQQDFSHEDLDNNIVRIVGKVMFVGSKPIKG